MKKQNFSSRIFAGKIFQVTVAGLVLFLSVVCASAKEIPIFRFNGENGSQPQAGLVAGANGHLYGTASVGGNRSCHFRGCGVVFELAPNSSGGWTEKVIHFFTGGTSDTSVPTTDLIFDTKGNLFGATGSNDNYGAVYELSPGTGGTWTEKVIYQFNNQAYEPGAHLAFDSQGNLYGSLIQTFNGNGAVFQLSPQSDGTWKETLIHSFTRTNGDGATPDGGVVIDAKGNIYGATSVAGLSNYGIVYELSPNGSGGFSESILFTFTGQSTGQNPSAPLTIDANGNLFGTTTGLVFELSPSGGKWNETVLYSFGGSPDGARASGVVFDAKGNLYSTTQCGGSGCNNPGCGIVFELSPQSGGSWKETILYNFESATDGSQSVAGVLIDSTGNIYGTTQYGGTRLGNGTVFEIQP
jgi:hypothetical protein